MIYIDEKVKTVIKENGILKLSGIFEISICQSLALPGGVTGNAGNIDDHDASEWRVC